MAACCARAGSGQAAAALPSSVMNSRRFMTDMGLAPPRAAGLPHAQLSTEGPAGPWANPAIEVLGLPPIGQSKVRTHGPLRQRSPASPPAAPAPRAATPPPRRAA